LYQVEVDLKLAYNVLQHGQRQFADCVRIHRWKTCGGVESLMLILSPQFAILCVWGVIFQIPIFLN